MTETQTDMQAESEEAQASGDERRLAYKVPAVGLAQEPANGTGNAKDEPGVVEKAIGKITGRSPKEAAKSGGRDSRAKSASDTDYPDRAAVKKK